MARGLLTPMQMQPVARVGEKIQLLRLLGRGGMGTVWLGRHEGALVAIKMMLPKLLGDPRAVARFERELRILGALRTSRAARLVCAGNHYGQPYAVMQNVDGVSLSDRFEASGGKPAYTVALRVIRELLAALGEVHAEGVVHRDVKPANVMLSGSEDEPRVTLVDFGVASSREEPRGESDAVTVGTGPYMSPEQLVEGGVGSVHEDMWAAAVVAYECLLGCLPFDGPSYPAVCVAVTSGVFVRPCLASPELPRALDGWFARAFARKLEDRFADVAEMADAFEAALKPAPKPKKSASPAPKDKHADHRVSSWSVLAAAFATAAVLVLVASELNARHTGRTAVFPSSSRTTLNQR